MCRDGRLKGTGLFDLAGIERLVDEHAAGHRDHHQILWTLLMFDAFLGHAGRLAGADRASSAGIPARRRSPGLLRRRPDRIEEVRSGDRPDGASPSLGAAPVAGAG